MKVSPFPAKRSKFKQWVIDSIYSIVYDINRSYEWNESEHRDFYKDIEKIEERLDKLEGKE